MANKILADQFQIEANELQAGHQREEEREVVVTADQSIPKVKRNQLQTILQKNSCTERGSWSEIQFPVWWRVWLTWSNISAVMPGSPERGVDSSLKSSHLMPGTATLCLHREDQGSIFNPLTACVNGSDWVREEAYFGRGWSLCAAARLSVARPPSWWSEGPAPSSLRRCPAACQVEKRSDMSFAWGQRGQEVRSDGTGRRKHI